MLLSHRGRCFLRIHACLSLCPPGCVESVRDGGVKTGQCVARESCVANMAWRCSKETLSSLRTRVNQSLSRFSLTIQGAANNAERCSKAPKETPHRIKAPPLCATHLKKVDENFNLPNPQSVRSGRNLCSAIVPLLCPRKTPCFKVFAGPFSKGRVLLPRTPSAYSFRVLLPRSPSPRSSLWLRRVFRERRALRRRRARKRRQPFPLRSGRSVRYGGYGRGGRSYRERSRRHRSASRPRPRRAQTRA